MSAGFAYKWRGGVLLLSILLIPLAAVAQQQPIDSAHSKLTVRVFKSGLFSAFAHNHEIAAPIAEGSLNASEKAEVTLRVDARALKVLDPDLAADKRAEVQQTMLGPDVLDATRFPDIRFKSTSVEKTGNARWTVHGDLTLHGTTRPLSFEVENKGGVYRGGVTLKQRDFGIQPVSIAGGTVKVKDEVKIEFEIIAGASREPHANAHR